MKVHVLRTLKIVVIWNQTAVTFLKCFEITTFAILLLPF